MKQIGGDHYKEFTIQPVDYLQSCVDGGVSWNMCNVIKYATRSHLKNQAAEDIAKAMHYLELELERIEK